MRQCAGMHPEPQPVESMPVMLLLFSDAVKEGPREDESGSPCRRRHALTRSSADFIHVPSDEGDPCHA